MRKYVAGIAAVAATAAASFGLSWSIYEASHDEARPASTTTTTEPVVVETVSLRLQEDGSWSCTGDVGECCAVADAWTAHTQNATPPEPLEAP